MEDSELFERVINKFNFFNGFDNINIQRDKLRPLNKELITGVIDTNINVYGKKFVKRHYDINPYNYKKISIKNSFSHKTKDFDVKDLWQLNRMDHIVSWSLVDGYKDKVIPEIIKWIEDNKDYKGNMVSALEVSVRCINWIVSIGNILVDIPNVVVQSLNKQYRFVMRNLSIGSSANNHLIGELCFIWLYNKVRDLHYLKFERMLEEEFLKQIHPSGTPEEQALDYLVFIIKLYKIIKFYGYSSVRVKDRIENAIKFLNFFQGDIPKVGDTDGNIFMQCIGIPFTEEQKDEKYCRYYSSGYVQSKIKNHKVLFKCTNLGYLSSAAHGHDDSLSLLVWKDGKQILIDRGTYRYYPDSKKQIEYKSSMSHNTITINGYTHSNPVSTMIWGRKSKGVMEFVESNEDQHIFKGYINGYQKDGVIVKRKITHNSLGVYIQDEIIASKHGTYKASFYFHKDSCNLFDLNGRNRRYFKRTFYAPEYGKIEECGLVEKNLEFGSGVSLVSYNLNLDKEEFNL